MKIAGVMAASMLLAAACGGSSGEGTQPGATESAEEAVATTLRSDPVVDTTADPATSESELSEPDTSATTAAETTVAEEPDSSGGEVVDGGLVSTALWSLPQVPAENGVQITVVDLAGSEELLGIEPATADDRLRWMAVAGPVDEGGLGFRVATPELFLRLGLGPDLLEEEVGFSLLDIDSTAEVSAAPERVNVFVGPDGWGGKAEPYQGDLSTIGQADDFEIDPASRSVLDSLGRPVRLAERDGRLAASFSTPVLEGWVDGSPATYAGDDRVSPIAEALDGHDVVSALLFIGDFFAAPPLFPEDRLEEFADLPYISQPFIAAGIGNTIRDGRAIEVVAYRFLTDDSAEAAMPSIETAWTTADSVVAPTPIADLAEFQSMERTGPVVTVVVAVPDGQVGRAADMLFSRDVTLAHL